MSTKSESKYLKSVAEQLRKARDLMNNGGRHWVKGAERALVDPESHEPGGTDMFSAHDQVRRAQGFEPAYCSIGALHEISADTLAAVTLAQVINPEEFRERRADLVLDAEEEYQHELDYYGPQLGYSKKQFIDEYVDGRIDGVTENIIFGFNDDNSTTWADVRGAFTKAAKRLADRAR